MVARKIRRARARGGVRTNALVQPAPEGNGNVRTSMRFPAERSPPSARRSSRARRALRDVPRVEDVGEGRAPASHEAARSLGRPISTRAALRVAWGWRRRLRAVRSSRVWTISRREGRRGRRRKTPRVPTSRSSRARTISRRPALRDGGHTGASARCSRGTSESRPHAGSVASARSCRCPPISRASSRPGASR
jgi:hypothetical protein